MPNEPAELGAAGTKVSAKDPELSNRPMIANTLGTLHDEAHSRKPYTLKSGYTVIPWSLRITYGFRCKPIDI
jgi:hypothetical protein